MMNSIKVCARLPKVCKKKIQYLFVNEIEVSPQRDFSRYEASEIQHETLNWNRAIESKSFSKNGFI